MSHIALQTMGKVKILLGAIISAFFLFLTVRGIDWRQVKHSLGQADYLLIIPAIMIHFTAFYIRSMKWSILVKKFKDVSANQLFPVIAIGLAMNNILPLRIGEVGRIIILSNKFKISKINATLSLVIERIFDIFGLLLVILVCSHLTKWPSYVQSLIGLAALFVILFIIATPILLSGFTMPAIMQRVQRIHGDIVTKLFAKIQEIKEGYFLYHDTKLIAKAVGLSFLLWLLEGLSYYTISVAFHLPVSIPAMILVCSLTNLASALPSTAGFIGTFDFFATGLMTFLGVAKSLAFSFVIVLHIELLLPVTIVGVYLYFANRYDTYISLQKIQEIENG